MNFPLLELSPWLQEKLLANYFWDVQGKGHHFLKIWLQSNQILNKPPVYSMVCPLYNIYRVLSWRGNLFPNVVGDLSFVVVAHTSWDNPHQQMDTHLSVPVGWKWYQLVLKVLQMTYNRNSGSASFDHPNNMDILHNGHCFGPNKLVLKYCN